MTQQQAFEEHEEKFKKHVSELDERLATIICMAIDDSNSLENTFKVLIHVLTFIFLNPLLSTKYHLVVDVELCLS